MQTRSSVPCNGCQLCCTNDIIILHPDEGDDPAMYLTQEIRNPVTGKPALMVQKKPNGHCIYLGPNGCSIHGRAPLICRQFDCRKLFRLLSRADRKRMVRAGMADQNVFDAGRERLHTLKDGD